MQKPENVRAGLEQLRLLIMGILHRSAGKIPLAIVLQTPPKTDSWRWSKNRRDKGRTTKADY